MSSRRSSRRDDDSSQPKEESWTVRRDAWGRLVVEDDCGEAILIVRSQGDPLRALRIAYLAAAAPNLRGCVSPLIKRFEAMAGRIRGGPMEREETHIGLAWMAMHEARPPVEHEMQACHALPQVEINWEDVA